MDSKLDIAELAKRWRCSENRLNHWRSFGIGLNWHKDGKKVYYNLSDVEEYEQNNWSVRGV
jgi:hypothetical protein